MKKLLFLTLLMFSVMACNNKLSLPKGNFVEFEKTEQLANASYRGVTVNKGLAVVAGSNSTVFVANIKTKNWQRAKFLNDENLEFRDAEILNENTILIMSAGEGRQSKIFKSSDKGETWNLVYENKHEKAFFDGFDFWDDKHGVLISDPIDERLYLLETTDGGETWTRLESKELPNLQNGEYGFAASGTGICTFDNGCLSVATGGTVARIHYSKNYGKNWSTTEMPIIQGGSSKGIFSVDYLNAKNAIAVGGDYQYDKVKGKNIAILNGKKWKTPPSAKVLEYSSCVQYLNQQLVLATGTTGTAVSTNAGDTFTYLGGVGAFHAISYDKANNIGLLSGANGNIKWFKLIEK